MNGQKSSKWLYKLLLFFLNALSECLTWGVGILAIGFAATSLQEPNNAQHNLTAYASLLFGIAILFEEIHAWIGAGKTLDKRFKKTLLEDPYKIDFYLPFSIFSELTVIQIRAVRMLVYTRAIVYPKSATRWADGFNFKKEVGFFDQLLVYLFVGSVAAAFLLFGVAYFIK